MNIPLDQIQPNPNQPRQVFDKSEIQSLANSMRINGQIQPILVEQHNGGYVLIAGERRVRAARLLGWTDIRAEVRSPAAAALVDSDRLVLALIENIQRQDMLPIEEARAYQSLRDQMGLPVNTIAYRTGKSNTHIHNRLKLLQLDREIQDLVNDGQLPVDARATDALMSVRDPETRIALARRLARPGQTIKAVVASCVRLNETLAAQVYGKHETPSLAYAAARAKTGPRPTPRWDALASLGRVPPWQVVTEAAKETCDACSLRELASDKTCRECPAVEILRFMLRAAQDREGNQ